MRRREAPSNPTVVRLPFLEGLRGLAALYVVISHICSMADPSRLAGKASLASPVLQALMSPFQYGHLAVAAFIVISGFCLQLSLFSNADGKIGSLRQWFRRRAKRILPAYYGALALSLLIAWLVTSRQTGFPFAIYLPITTENVLAHIFMVHNLSLDWMYKINGVMWSIAIEAQLYLLFPLLVASVFRIGRWPTFIVSAIAAGVVIAVIPNAPKLYPWYLALFVMGMLSAHMAYRPNLRWGTLPWVAATVAAAGVVAAGVASVAQAPMYLCDAFVGVGVAALCYLMTVTEEGMACRALSWKPIVGLGAFSYSLYLMHHPLEQVVYVTRPAFVQGPEAIFWYLVIVGLPLVLLGTWAFSLVFERPFITRRDAEPERTVGGITPTSLPLKTYTRVEPEAVAVAAREGFEYGERTAPAPAG